MKQKSPTIIDTIQHKDLFGSLSAFSNLDTWKGWLAWLKAVFALPMSTEELAIFRESTGRNEPPSQEPSEVYTIVGRRGGESFVSALVAVYLACFGAYRGHLTPVSAQRS